MKKFYVTAVVFLSFIAAASSQDIYWVGPADGNWNDGANWSATSGGTGGVGVPGILNNVIFNSNATVLLNASPEISRLTVTNNATVKITSVGDPFREIFVTSTSATDLALQIDAGSMLEDSAATGSSFAFIFGDNTKAAISGTWYFSGSDIDNGNIGYFTLPEDPGQSTNVSVKDGGSIVISSTAGAIYPNELEGDNYLEFESGSLLHLMTDGAAIPKAIYDVASTIRLSGFKTAGQGLVVEETASIGNLIYDCSGQEGELSLGLKTIIIEGDVSILNTNAQPLVLMSNTVSGGMINLYVKGDLEISGNSNVVLSKADVTSTTRNFYLDGNLTVGGNSFNIQSQNFEYVTNLLVKGNITHTSGTFGVSSTANSLTTSYFNLELNGTTAQTISSTTGVFGNDQLTLRINNAAGVTLNNSLTVGRIDLVSGILNTGANALTINNDASDEESSIVVKVPAPSTSYVNGIVRRQTGAAGSYLFPVGNGSYSGATVHTATADASVFEAQYINTAHSSTTVAPALLGISNTYHWIINRTSGAANASIELPVKGAVNGASIIHDLAVARYDGAVWRAVKGEDGTTLPGNSTSGTVTSEVLTDFSPFTIGYGLTGTLPIHLESFNAKKVDKEAAQVTWKISENSTPDRFEVTRSDDGVNFTTLGSVAGIEGVVNYQFTDNAIAAGNNYYRLKMFDKDGSVSFSGIVVVMNGTKGVVISSMIPTIVKDRARLTISSSIKGNLQLVVTDINGRILQNQKVSLDTGNQEVWLDASRLATGVFQVTGYINGQRTAAIRFIKQ